MKTKKVKNLNNEKHYVGALLENMDSKIDVLVDGHKFLVKGQKTLEKRVDDLKGEMNERFNEVDYKFEIVFGELRLIRNELKEKVGRDEFTLLEKRVFALEKSRK